MMVQSKPTHLKRYDRSVSHLRRITSGTLPHLMLERCLRTDGNALGDSGYVTLYRQVVSGATACPPPLSP